MDLSSTLRMGATTPRTAGEQIASSLADIGVRVAFGVISIHNMPILDAIARQGRIRFVPARGEAGAMNMADAYARVSQTLGVVFTSTGTAAGNAAGSQIEALTAGSPVLHITSQVDRAFVDRDRAAIHDAPRQPDMLKAVSKAYFRIWEPESAADILSAAASAALNAPAGPVTLEIPVDVQRLPVTGKRTAPVVAQPLAPSPALLDLAVALIARAKRPLLWLGGGARGASAAATELVERGFGAVTSTNGRATVAEGHERSLGAFNMTPEAQRIYANADLIVVVGSRLRGNETHNNDMPLPRPLVQIDADWTQAGRNYPADLFIGSDARLALEGLLSRLPARLDTDKGFLRDIGAAREQAETNLRAALGPYQILADALRACVWKGRRPWVRDVTIANSTFGNRFVRIAAPNLGVHALGGGIGQGIAMGIGAALVSGNPKAIVLLGDGGSQLMIGELATAVEARAPAVFLLMNDRGYGVIRNIQDAQYEGRRVYTDILTPDFGLICQAVGMAHERLAELGEFANVLERALARPEPCMIEIDMTAVGSFRESFAGPPAGAAGGRARP